MANPLKSYPYLQTRCNAFHRQTYCELCFRQFHPLFTAEYFLTIFSNFFQVKEVNEKWVYDTQKERFVLIGTKEMIFFIIIFLLEVNFC